ncbi:hypothetical protein [Streptomyces morookaense]|uniref:Uncharacterized protein n=1 Tax=Streptomyces morookaense TaxID=1970 RepID=A0A7Y7E747_STRMO|nr:hypothetical protein [Streptomyces morookaense]NVK78585.1 hypothetical protein [Streptomyces morookaense]GHF33564.1 hypothetical protein GCM10010359_40360 [Streptomyces morookaense]
MSDTPVPDEPPPGNRSMIGMLIKRDLPDRSGPPEWCGKHPKERTQLVARIGWVCLDCVRERSRPQP